MSRKVIYPVIILFVIIVQAHAQQQTKMAAFKMMQLFEWVGNYYMDDVHMGKLSDDMIRKTLQELDPHSVYIMKDDVKAMTEPLEGAFEGIGVSFNILNDTIIIISAISGGPSDKLGIRGGDRIITVDGKNIAGVGIKTGEIHRMLRGKKGTAVAVGVKRNGYDELLDFRITRDKIPIYSIDAAYKVNNHIGYIKLSRFAASSQKEFNKALEQLTKDGMTDLILDLTGNGGGYIDVAVRLADNFFEGGQLIVYTEGEHYPRRNYVASSRGAFRKGKLVVLIDEGSASASEILAGAIQDWDRGTIIGRRSFGKGLVQRQMLFPDSSMLRLTIAKYYTPAGRMIQKPYQSSANEYTDGIYSRLEKGELTDENKNTFPDSLKYTTLIKQRTVYGGGGIMPDIFIPLDTAFNNAYYRKLWNTGTFNKFTLEYTDKNRISLEDTFPEFDLFNTFYQVSDEMLKELTDFAEKEGITMDEKLFEQGKSQIKQWLKGYVARNLWGLEKLYMVTNQTDEAFCRAIKEITD